MLIEVFLNSVYVFNDKIVISCNYKDGTKTVNFSEMESALTLRASVSGSDLDCPGAPKKFRKLLRNKRFRNFFFIFAFCAFPSSNGVLIQTRFFGFHGLLQYEKERVFTIQD